MRGETERTATSVDDVKSYYIATGAIERAALYMEWATRYPDRYPRAGTPVMSFQFPNGEATVEIIPETSKFNLNNTRPEELFRLLAVLTGNEQQAREITDAIVDWRTPVRDGGPGLFDDYYLSRTPSFPARHASFEETEELLLLKGMTRDVYYGSYITDTTGPQPRLVARGGIRDCVSIFGATDRFDVNTAQPAVLAAIGLAPEQVAALVEHRRRQPFLMGQELAAFTQGAGPAAGRLRLGGNAMYTLRATARLRLPGGQFSDLRRTVSALIHVSPGTAESYQVMRWYDRG